MNQYWPTREGTELLEELLTRIETFDKHLDDSGVLNELRDSYKHFYGNTIIQKTGTQGELSKIKINHYASLIRSLTSLVTNNKPAWQPIASNSDVASQSSAILASGLLDFYMKDRRLDRLFRNATIMCCFLREAWVSATWDTQRGEIIHPGDEQSLPLHEGDLSYSLYQLNNIIRDISRNDGQNDWLIVRDYKNKYELIAQFPEYEEQLMHATIDGVEANMHNLKQRDFFNVEDSDLVEFYTFHHKQTAALPNGRMVTFVKGQLLTDGPLPYPKIPLVRITAEDCVESCFGHSPAMDILPIQKAVDSLASILITNNNTFGVQNIWSKKGNGLSVTQIAGGLNMLESEVKPEPLQMTASAPETYKFFDMLVQQSQLISGVNDAVRGQSDPGTSGAALALLSQQAIQFANGLQQGYISLIEDVGTLSIQILQRYANTKRVAILSGKHNQPLIKEWSSQDLQGVSRITIEAGNALSKTASGKLTIADSLMQNGFIKSGQQYIQVLSTGNLEPLLESEQSQMLRIRRENELMQEGQPVRAIMTDDHSLDIREHLSILDNPEVRQNEALVSNVLMHVQEHIDLAKNLDPVLSAMLGRQSFMMQAPPQGPGPAPAEVTDPTNPVTEAAGQVNQPNMPTNPATGEQPPQA
jgi:hypothetical protein